MRTAALSDCPRRHIGLVSEAARCLAGNSSPLADEILQVTYLGPPSMTLAGTEIAAKFCLLLLVRPGLAATHAFCRRIRSTPALSRIPIIVVDDPVHAGEQEALRAGADQFIAMPVSTLELKARIAALLRRIASIEMTQFLKVGELELDFSRMLVARRGRTGELSMTEFRLLEILMREPDTVLSRERIRDDGWGAASTIHLRTIDVHVGRLRKLLNARFRINPIQTVRGKGYQFVGRST